MIRKVENFCQKPRNKCNLMFHCLSSLSSRIHQITRGRLPLSRRRGNCVAYKVSHRPIADGTCWQSFGTISITTFIVPLFREVIIAWQFALRQSTVSNYNVNLFIGRLRNREAIWINRNKFSSYFWLTIMNFTIVNCCFLATALINVGSRVKWKSKLRVIPKIPENCSIRSWP